MKYNDITCDECGRVIGKIESTVVKEADDPYCGVFIYCEDCKPKEK